MMKISNDKQRCTWHLMLVVLTMLLVSCHECNLYQGDEEGELDIENLFDFSTAQTVTLDVKYDLNAKSQIYFEVYTQNPMEVGPVGDKVKKVSLKPVFTGKTAEGGRLSYTIEIPAAIEKLYFYSPSVIAPTLVVGDIVNKQVVIANATEYDAASVSSFASTRASTAGTYYKNWATQKMTDINKLGEWDVNGRPDYLQSNDLQFSDAFMSILNKLLPADDNMDATTFQYNTLTLKEEANVDMYFVSHGNSARHNALAYYTFVGKTHPTQAEVNKSLTIIFPDLASNSLKSGNGVRLKYRNGNEMQENFPKGSTIGWVLLVNACQNNKIENPCNALYSWNEFNGYDFIKTSTTDATLMRDRPHMGAFRSGDDVVLSFEDQPWGGGKPANFRDDVFVLKTNPITAIPDDVIDPDNAAKNKSMQEGIYLFEDNWPATGDYDLNDVMVKYASTFFYDDELRIYNFEHTFTFAHSGATYQNAFGFQLGELVLRSNIESYDIESTDVNFAGMGLDPNLDIATFMVYNDGRYAKDKVVTLKIKLKTPIGLEDYSYSKGYNPFIVVKGLNETDRTEVHLRNFKPTTKANMSLLGTDGDKSNPADNFYYVSNDNHPFALDVRTTDEFVIPEEGKGIEYTYPKFTEWATTEGKSNKDWYLHPSKK